MSALTAARRGDLAEEMLPVAARLATLVHGDGGPEDIARLLDVLDDAERTALIVVLAGLADPDRPLGELLGWVDFDEHAQTTAPDEADQTTLRALADELDANEDANLVDEVAVARCLAGRPVTLSPAERIVVIQRGAARGLDWKDFDRLFARSGGYTQQFFDREQKRAALRGEVLESGIAPRKLLTAEDARQMRVLSVEHGWPADRLARRWDMTVSAVRKVLCGETHPNAGGPIRKPTGRGAGPRVAGLLSTPVQKSVRQSAAS